MTFGGSKLFRLVKHTWQHFKSKSVLRVAKAQMTTSSAVDEVGRNEDVGTAECACAEYFSLFRSDGIRCARLLLPKYIRHRCSTTRCWIVYITESVRIYPLSARRSIIRCRRQNIGCHHRNSLLLWTRLWLLLLLRSLRLLSCR